jgi:1,4-alpha-glucan branching enzyme
MFMQILDQNLSATHYSAKSMAKPVHFYCYAPKAQMVHLVGDFNDWNPTVNTMKRQVDGWWFIEADLTHGHHCYRFLVDGKPILDPQAHGVAHDEEGKEVSVLAVS